MTKKKTSKVQIFKLEERVLFDGAAAAEIVAAVDNAAQQQADQDADSDQDQEEKLIQNTIQNAGPVDTPAPEANVQNEGEGLPQADAAAQDPADILINGNADFTQITDPNADFSAQIASNLDSDASDFSVAPQTPSELVILDPEAADQFDSQELEGKTVLVLDPDSDADAAEQINDWLDEHDDQSFDSVRIVSADDADDADDASDSFLLDADEIEQLQNRLGSDADIESLSASEFDSELAAENSDMIIFPDSQSQITVDSELEADTLPDALEQDAEAGRHELVILNSSTAELDNVLDQLGDSREVLIIDTRSELSGLEQIQNYLAEHNDTQYDAVHVLTHGNDYGVFIGSDFVTDSTDFSVFSDHISSDGDLMLYGCSMASSDRGQILLQGIADAAGADVAASVNTTGSADLGGDWILEYASGSIETASISLDATWNHRFETITVDAGAKDRSATLCKTLQEALVDGWNYGSSDHHGAVTANDSLVLVKVTDGAANFNIAGLTVSASGSLKIPTVFTVSAPTEFSGGILNGALTITNTGILELNNVEVDGGVTNNGTVTGTMLTGVQQAGVGINIGTGQWGGPGVKYDSFTLTQGVKGGTINITGGTFTDAQIELSKGSLNISGGNFTLIERSDPIVNASDKADVTISGGTFRGRNTENLSGSGTGVYFSGKGDLFITGGTFQYFTDAVSFSGSAPAFITGGSFTNNLYGITHSGSKVLTVQGNVTIQNNVNDTTISWKPTSGAGIRNIGSGGLLVYNLTNPISGNYYGIYNESGAQENQIYSDTVNPIEITDNWSSGIHNAANGQISYLGNVTLSGNGLKTDGQFCYFVTDGGGIHNEGKILNVSDVEISGNFGDKGGGIYNSGVIGAKTYTNGIWQGGIVANLYITNNLANEGGGIYQATGGGNGYFDFNYNSDDIKYSLIADAAGTTPGLAGNYAVRGGGIYFDAGSWKLGGEDSPLNITDNIALYLADGYFAVTGAASPVVGKAGYGHAQGGGIYLAADADVILDTLTISGNEARSIDAYYNPSYWDYYYNKNTGIADVPPQTDQGGFGGGIYNLGTLTVLRSNIHHNTVEFTNDAQLPNYYAYLSTLAQGGGIYSTGTLSVYDSYIHENTATNGFGGGVSLAGGTASFVSTEYYTGNTLWALAGDYAQNSMVVKDNLATSWSDGTKYAAGGFGGGIYADSSVNLTLDSVTVAGNRATLTVVTDTTAGTKYDLSRGGGLYFGEAYLYQVDYGVFSAPSFGSGTLTIDGTVRSWVLNDDVAPLATNLRNTKIFGNNAVSGSGLFIAGSGTGTIGNAEIYDNDYTVKTDFADAHLNADGYFTDVKVAQDQFKLLVNSSEQVNWSLTGKPNLTGTQISAAGQLFTASGSGLYFGGAGMTLSTDGVTFYSNANANSDGLGGGVYAVGSLFTNTVNHLNLVNATVYDNAGAYGGGVYISDKAVVNILDTTIAGNKAAAAANGGGVYITGNNAALNILNSILVGNTDTTGADAGDVAVESDATPIKDMYSLFNTVLVKNHLTKEYEQLSADPTSSINVLVADIFEGGTLAGAWGNIGEVYSKTIVVDNQTYYYDYSYATTRTLAIDAEGAAAYKGVYTAINTANSTMYYNTLSSKTVAAGETSGVWKNFTSGSTASIDDSYIVDKGQNGLNRLQQGIYVFNIGAYQLVSKDSFFYDLAATNQLGGPARSTVYTQTTGDYRTFTDSGEYYVRAIVGTTEDTVNPYDGYISLREAIRLAGEYQEFNYTVNTAIYGDNPAAPMITEKFHFGTEIVFDQTLINDGDTFDVGNSNIYGTTADSTTANPVYLTSSYYDSLGINKALQDQFGNNISYRLVSGTVDATDYTSVTVPTSTIKPFIYDATQDAGYAAISVTFQVANDVNGDVGRFRMFDVVNGDFTLYADGSQGKSITLLGGNVSNDNNPSRQESERVSESAANYGGVIGVSGANATFTLINTTVDRGTANRGGGIYVANGTLNLLGTTSIGGVNGNIAQGFLNASDPVDPVEYAVAGNRYVYTAGDGAGIYVAAGSVVVGQDYSEIEKTQDPYYSYKNVFHETNLTVQNGEAALSGGGIYLGGGSFTTNFNLYKDDGAGGYAAANESFDITNNQAVNGAGIYVAGSAALTLERTEINANTLAQGASSNLTVPTEGIPASYGGGIYAASGSTVTLRGVNIHHNVTAVYDQPGAVNPSAPDYVVSYGGGIYSAGTVTVVSSGLRALDANSQIAPNLDFQESSVSNNEAVNGGGVYAASGSFTMSGTGYNRENLYHGVGQVNGNTALAGSYTNETSNTTGQGGGIYVAANATANLTDVVFTGNTATYIASENGNVNASDNLSGRGGAVYNAGWFGLHNSDPANADPIYLNANTADMGGAVYQAGGKVWLLDLSMFNNTATQSGTSSGAALYVASGTANLGNVTIANNTASRGVIQLDEGATLNLTDATVGLNTVASSAIIVNGSATLNLYNTLVIGNGANGYRNIEGNYTNDGYSLVGTIENSLNAELIFGANVFSDPTTVAGLGIIALNDNAENPAVAGGHLYSALDQLGNDRTEIPGGGVYSVGAVVAAGDFLTDLKVNTFSDDITFGNALYSLREAIADAEGQDITIEFDVDALQMEIDGGTAPHFLLNSALSWESGTVTLDFSTLSSLAFTGTVLSVQRDFADPAAGMFVLAGSAALVMSNITVDGDNVAVNVSGAAFNVASGTSLTLETVNVTNANTTRLGGVIYAASNSTVTVNGTNNFTNNTADRGGVIYAAAQSTVTVNGVNNFTGNNADFGGVFYVAPNSNMTVNGSNNFIGNTANVDGGAVFIAVNSALSLAGTNNFDSNVATAGSGGAIYTAAGDFELTGTATNNTAGLNGGAIYSKSGAVSLNGAVYGNSAGSGGAVYAESGAVTVTGELSDNHATAGSGGAVYAADGAVSVSVTHKGDLINGAVYGNTATDNGGAVYAANGDVSIQITDAGSAVGTVELNTADNGGAVYAENGSVTITGRVVSNIAATSGGAVYTVAGAATITGDVSGNIATAGDGGAVYANGLVTVTGKVYDNRALAGSGGAVLSFGGATLTGNVYGNRATAGGAVFAPAAPGFDDQIVTVNGNLYDNHATAGSGGAVYANGSVIVSGKVYDNNATVDGGAIYVDTLGTVNITGAVYGNTATTGRGGAIYNDVDTVTLTGELSNNTAGTDGGGIYAGGDVSITVTADDSLVNGAVYSNMATAGSGGAVYMANADSSLTVEVTVPTGFEGSIEIENNTAGIDGGAFYIAGSGSVAGNVKNNIATAGSGGAVYVAADGSLEVTGDFTANKAGADGGAVYVAANGSAEITGNITGLGNDGSAAHKAAEHGGAVYVAAGGSLTVEGDLTYSQAEIGGAIYNDGGTVSITGNMENNRSTKNGSFGGGAIYNRNGGNVTVIGDLTGNIARRGGAVFNDSGATGSVTIGDADHIVSLDNNTVNKSGGAIYNRSGALTVYGNFTGNTATENGGALLVHDNSGVVQVIGNFSNNNAAAGSAVYQQGGYVQIGDADHYGSINDNGDVTAGNVITMTAGNMLVYNTAITGNDATGAFVFDVQNGATFTLLNSTVNANAGDVFQQTGTGMVQIGDSTIYQPLGNMVFSDATFTGLSVVNSIITVNTDLSPAVKVFNSLINQPDANVFDLSGGIPVVGPNGTLQIKFMGDATLGGALAGYTVSGDFAATTLYYSIDGGSTWQDADGNAGTPDHEITVGQNEVERGTEFVSIGAFALSNDMFSTEVTTGDDDPIDWYDDKTSLREAMTIASYLMTQTGNTQTVTFADDVDNVDLNSTVTADQSVNVSGSGVTVSAVDPGAGFTGDSVFELTGGDILLAGLTIEGMAGVRGIDVNGANLTLSDVTIQNGDATGDNGGAIYVQNGTLAGSNVRMVDNTADSGAAVYANGPVALSDVTVSGNEAVNGDVIYANGSVTLTDATVSNNTATNGDVIDATGDVSVSGNVSGNTATDDVISAGGAVTVTGDVSSNTATNDVIESGGAVTVTGNVSGNTAQTGNVVSAADNVTVAGDLSGNTATIGDVISAGGAVTVTGDVSSNTATDDVIEAGGAVTVTGNVSGNTAQTGNVVSAVDNVTVAGDVSGNTATDDVISTQGNVAVTGNVSGNTADDVIRSALGDVSVSGNVSGNTATTGDVIESGGTVTVAGDLSSNTAQTGNVVNAADNVTVAGSISGNTAANNVIGSAFGDVMITGDVSDNTATNGDVIGGVNVTVSDAVVSGNTAGGSVINSAVSSTALNSTLTDNTAGGAVISSNGDATLVNTTMAYNTGDAVNAGGTAKVANSIVMGTVDASETQAAYSVFSETPANLSVNDHNVTDATESAIFSGRDSSGNLIVREDSVASMGVWTAYNPDNGDVYYSTQPEFWTQDYNAQNMEWKLLGGGSVSYSVVSSYLLSAPDVPQSIGAYSVGGRASLPDSGPGVNSFMGAYALSNFDLFGFSTYADLEDGWYSPLYEQLFGRKYEEMGSFSVLNGRGDLDGVPNGEELDISVNGTLDEDFQEFVEEPYYENGTPLTAEELNQIRQAAVTGSIPEESVTLQADVDQDVASALKKADLFKDSLDWALDSLLSAKI